MRLACSTVVPTDRDAVTTSVSFDCVTEVPTSSHAVQSFVATGCEAAWRATVKVAATSAGTAVQDLTGTGSVREDEEEYVIEKLAGHICTEMGMQYRVRRLGYNLSEDTYEPAELLVQLFHKRY